MILCFELQSQSSYESKGKGLKVVKTNLTLKGRSNVKSETIKRFGAHGFLEVVFTSQTSLKLIIKEIQGIKNIIDPV